MNAITIPTPFDRHGHLRELNTLMKYVLKYTARQYWGMIVMPNLRNPIVRWEQAADYYKDIQEVLREQQLPKFTPIMTAYLTDNSNVNNITEGFKNRTWRAAKLYPHGATTNSDEGVTKLENIFPVLEAMQKNKMPLLVHPETGSERHEILFENRERVYTEESLALMHREFPELIISVEHISTKEAAQFVESTPFNVVGTVTPQHLLLNHNALFDGGVFPYKPGMYVENMCLPILKWPEDVEYLRQAVMVGEKRFKFGAGTDTAPHDQNAKHDHCSRCGCFNATHAVELYAMAFEEKGELRQHGDSHLKDTFEDFMSRNNLWIYDLETSDETLTLIKKDQTIPELVPGDLRPFKAGQTIPWKIHSRE